MLRKINKQQIIIQDEQSGLTVHNVTRTVKLMKEDELLHGTVEIKGQTHLVEKRPTDTTWYNAM